MPTFDFRFNVPASQERVRAFHSDASALKKLTPPPTIIVIHKVEPLADDSIAEFTLWFGPIPIRWKAIHQAVSQQGFTDIQVEGPAAKWEHTHTFEACDDDTTAVHEHIEYEHKRGLRGLLTRILFSKANLYVLFSYRKFATRRHLSKKQPTATS